MISDSAWPLFTIELAEALRLRGIDVSYSYCACAQTLKGGFENAELDVDSVDGGRNFDKCRIWRRLWCEIRFGTALGRVVVRRRPEVHVFCNMPLVSMGVARLVLLPVRTRSGVWWFQDAQSGLVAGLHGCSVVTHLMTWLETTLLRQPDAVIAIRDRLATAALELGVRVDRVTLVPNWAPVDRFGRWTCQLPYSSP